MEPGSHPQICWAPGPILSITSCSRLCYGGNLKGESPEGFKLKPLKSLPNLRADDAVRSPGPNEKLQSPKFSASSFFLGSQVSSPTSGWEAWNRVVRARLCCPEQRDLLFKKKKKEQGTGKQIANRQCLPQQEPRGDPRHPSTQHGHLVWWC